MLIYRFMALLLPVKKNILIFHSNLGKNYTGNPKAIYETFVKLHLDRSLRLVWAFQSGVCNLHLPGKVTLVTYGRFRYYYYMAVAKVWVFDSRQESFLKKRKNCIYLQTWHGTPLKKLALDMEEMHMTGESNLEEYKQKFRKETLSWDYLIAQNEFSVQTFRRCFAFGKEILKTGYPRNDILIQKNSKENIKALKQKYQLPLNKKIFLYAPTWRDNQFLGEGWYKFTTDLDFEAFHQAFQEDVFLLVKYHYLVKSKIDFTAYQKWLRVCDHSYDISELYLVSDALITDYSSVMFDYALLKRPMFFYTYDLEEYRDQLRGFYFDFLSEAPGPVVCTTKDLTQAILTYQQEEFLERQTAFFEKYTMYDNGQASEQITRLLYKTLR